MSEHHEKLDAVFGTGVTDTGNGGWCLRVRQIVDFVMNVLGFMIEEPPDELFSNENTFFGRNAFGINRENAVCLVGFILFRLTSGGLT